MDSPSARHKLLFGAIVSVGVIVYAGFNVLVYQYSKSGGSASPATIWQAITKSGAGFQTLNPTGSSSVIPVTPSPTPTPYPIAQGKQVYNVNTNAKSGPKIGKVTIDPLDAKIGETQMIAVVVKSTNVISGVLVALRTDKNVLTNHKLALSSGTAMDGIWSGSWKMEVIHDYLYQVIVTATDTETSNSTTITIR